ncbi:Pr6Pr family membrane protein [Flavobacterium sp.]|uniref:Pr6Pr family membrane protein n=2 Tax=Flavobacterium TaxID=237 RepID=UPI0039E36DB6
MNLKNNLIRIGFLLGWFTLIAQYIIFVKNSETNVLVTNLKFFTYFTILSNLMVTLFYSFCLFYKKSQLISYTTQITIVIYITIVAIVYNCILRFIWNPNGLSKILDELLHVINPVLFIIIWFKNNNRYQIPYRYIFKILIFPLFYLSLVLILGFFIKHYPYPFLDVNTIGYEVVLLNSVGVTILFVLTSIVFIYFSNKRI